MTYEGTLTPEILIAGIADLTDWDMTLAEDVITGRGGMSVCFADSSALFTGPPDPQNEEFFMFSVDQLAQTILDSTQKTLQMGFTGEGGVVTIKGGNVTATGITGIGNGKSNSNVGTFEANGNAFIVASSIADQSGKKGNKWSGVIFENTTGYLYGDSIILTTDAEIPNGSELTIQTLTIGGGVTLNNEGAIHNNGTIKVQIGGALNGNSVGGIVKYLSNDTGVKEVWVDETPGDINGTKITVSLPYGRGLSTGCGKIDIILTDENATVSTPSSADNGATWTFTVTAKDGKAVFEKDGGSSGGEDGPSTPTYGSNTLSNSGITLSGSDIHKDARLTVTPNKLHDGQCAECDQIRRWQEQGRVIAIYDVSLSYGFRGTVTLTFPVSSAYNGKTLTVVHCLKDKLDSYDVVVSNGQVTVTADGLSPFAILDNSKNESGKESSDTGTENPGTGTPFTDVKETDWLCKSVMFVFENGLMTGSGGISPWVITGLCALPAALLIGTAAVIIKRRKKMKAGTTE